jgi:hypothetical protein
MQPLGYFKRGSLATVRRFLDADLFVQWATGSVKWDPKVGSLSVSFSGRAPPATEAFLTVGIQASNFRVAAGTAPVLAPTLRNADGNANVFFVDPSGRVAFGFDPTVPS